MVSAILKKVPGQLAFEVPKDYETRERLIKLFSECKTKYCNFVQVSFSIPRKKRTSGKGSQNSCIHGYAKFISDYTGEETDRVLYYAKVRAFKRGYPYKKNENGEIIMSLIDGEPVPESSANISTLECGYLIEELIQIASELDVVLPKTKEW